MNKRRYMEIAPESITRADMEALRSRVQDWPFPIALVWYKGATKFDVWAAGDEGGGEMHFKEWWQVEDVPA